MRSCMLFKSDDDRLLFVRYKTWCVGVLIYYSYQTPELVSIVANTIVMGFTFWCLVWVLCDSFIRMGDSK